MTETGDRKPLTGSSALIVEITELKAQVATLIRESDGWRSTAANAVANEVAAEARADKAESAITTVTAERDAALRDLRTGIFSTSMNNLIERATSAEQALAGVRERMARIEALVNKQAEDEGLWFQPVHITEDVLQKALRELHEIIEGKTSTNCAIAILALVDGGK